MVDPRLAGRRSIMRYHAGPEGTLQCSHSRSASLGEHATFFPYSRTGILTSVRRRGDDMPRGKRIGLPALFTAFFRLGVMSFGGATAGWLYREIVERRHWISDKEFLSGAALGRLAPGS